MNEDDGEVEERERGFWYDDDAGNEGTREDTDDHLRGCEFALEEPADGGSGDAMGWTGCTTLSKNLTNGNNEATAAAVDGGELGNGKWMIAFALGGGRTGNSFSPSPSPSSS